MRYIGNKTRLLDFLDQVLDSNDIRGGRAFDAFSGTASVGRHLKRRGFHVAACDVMTYSFVFQNAYVVTDAFPTFQRVLNEDEELRRLGSDRAWSQLSAERAGLQTDLFGSGSAEGAIGAAGDGIFRVFTYLEKLLSPATSMLTKHYSPFGGGEEGGRMYYTANNAQRIDSIRERLHSWRTAGLLTDTEYFVLLACLLEAADAVANTAGVYAAFIKSWQSNALRPIRLPYPELVTNSNLSCTAIQGDAIDAINGVGSLDVLYLDPPYNTRQYGSYYHLPELIAKGWYDGEPEIRGKTGLIDLSDKRSDWSTRGRCVDAFESLMGRARATHVLMSYNSEGIIPESDIERVLRGYGESSSYRVFERRYDRYKADSESEKRQYKADSVVEKIYYVKARRSG
jgi:adenine-specific DNA-methyltransferase